MKILFVSLLLPHRYADHASAFTVFKTIRHLSKKHDISLISFVRSESETAHLEDIREYCRIVKTVVLPQGMFHKVRARAGLLGGKPISVSNSYCRQMSDCIGSMCRSERFDVVQVEYTPMGQYVSEIGNTPSVINVHDLIHVTTERFAENPGFSRKRLEWWADSLVCRDYELRLLSRFSRVLALSENIRNRLGELNSSLNVSVVRPGVDIPPEQKLHSQGRARNLIFMGAMWRDENIDAVLYFYRSIFSRIRKAIPDVNLYIVGGSPSERITSLASDPSVKVCGYAADLLPWYLNADVSIAPMRVAGGVMCKILDAMAAGLPVITTSQGNEGIAARPGEQIVIADDPEEFADSTIEMLCDGNRRRMMGQRGVDFVRSNFSLENTIDKLEAIYQRCMCQDREYSSTAAGTSKAQIAGAPASKSAV
jgi:glycosyltransferase involved in cell wall biosynthesis